MTSRGRVWFERIAAGVPPVPDLPPSVLAADLSIGGRAVRAIAVVPDADARFVRARNGEVGIDEGYGIARAVADSNGGVLAIVDVPGQAFGRREEELGLQCALAAAVEAYATKRRSGFPVAALIVGKAISGAFLAHGMQAGWIGALRDPQIEVHVMSAAATARVTTMAPDEIARLADEIPATSREIERFAAFGAIDALFDVRDPRDPSPGEIDAVAQTIAAAIQDPRLGTRNPIERLYAPHAQTTRALARDVRARIEAQWNA
jgi:biotin-independent malonate decarboxylase gamma subunit